MQTRKYRFDFTNFYRIWISDDPNVFLGLEDQLRFINVRNKHPSATFNFIYSSKYLTPVAQEKLKAFCKRHNIVPVDFDTDIPPLLKNEREKIIYASAKLEIDNTLNGQYGNLAAAADCLRTLTGVITKFGVYSDFDVSFNLNKYSTYVIELNAPILMSYEVVPFGNGILPSPNSDFLAYARNASGKELDVDALRSIENLQIKIVENYSKPFSFDILVPCNKATFTGYVLMESVYKQIVKNKKSLNVFEFRKLCQTTKDVDATVLESLYKASVAGMAGPLVYGHLYKQYAPKREPFCLDVLTTKNLSQWQPYLDMFVKSCIDDYLPIKACITITNKNFDNGKRVKPVSDESWTKQGAANKKAREAKMLAAGHTLFSGLRSHGAARASFLLKAKKLCSAENFEALKQKKYSLVLRRACSDLNLPLVNLLLQFRKRVPPQAFKLDEASSNGNTALDWAMQSKTQNEHAKKEICQLLIDAGAKKRENVARP